MIPNLEILFEFSDSSETSSVKTLQYSTFTVLKHFSLERYLHLKKLKIPKWFCLYELQLLVFIVYWIIPNKYLKYLIP